MPGPIYIVLPLPGVGGMEKRLAGLFLHLASGGADVRLVAPARLVDALTASAELARLDEHRARMDLAPGAPSIPELRRHVRALARRSPDAVFHYGLVSPLRVHPTRSRRVLYTIPNANLAQYSRRGLVEVYGGVLRSGHVDVLDPEVHRQLSARFFWRRRSLSLTPGSWVDLERFAPLPGAEKENAIAFIGLFLEEKQAPRLAAAIPELLRACERAGIERPQVWMMGSDGSTPVTAQVAALNDPRARAWQEPNPASVLARAKVILSLQRVTNHPSKSLLEGMACGAAPVVTDTRDSRRTAPESLATYIPRDFTADDLARACVPLLQRAPAAIDAHAAKLRAFLAANFSLEAMTDYYRDLYAKLARL